MLRTTTRISHSQSPVVLSDAEREKHRKRIGIEKDPERLVMLPNNARKRHVVVEERMENLRSFSNTFTENKIEWGKTDLGIITAGISYQYAREVFPTRPFLSSAWYTRCRKRRSGISRKR